jgi:signal peptidase II
MPRWTRFRAHRLSLVLALLFGTVGCDQATKAVARDALVGGQAFDYLGGLIRLQIAENPGAFLSLGGGLPSETRFWLFTVSVCALLLGLLAFALLARRVRRDTLLALTLIASGGLGNLVDRATKQSVTDFLIIGTPAFHTGVFNVADVAIVVGVLIMLAQSVFRPSSHAAKRG